MYDRCDSRLREIPASYFHDLVMRLSEIDHVNGWFQGRGLADAPMLRRLKKRVVDISAAASLRIGGRDRPQAAVPARWRGDPRRRRLEPHDAAHVAGYAELLQAAFDGYRHMPFGEDLILQFHARVLKYSHTDQPHRGRYKTAPDSSRSYLRRQPEPPALRAADPDRTPLATAALSEWTGSRLAGADFHPLLVIAGFVLEFLAIRPFSHGNGRVSRLLTNLLLLQCGYTYVPYASLEAVIADGWTEYYGALRRSQLHANLPRPDITPWLTVFLETLQVQSRQLKAALGSRADLRLLSPNQLRVLNLLERSGDLTNRLIRDELGLPKDTAKQVLNRLLALNLLQRVGAGRAVRYQKALLQPDTGAAR